ncbi:MAG: hypothetical protein B7Z72_12960 [Gemmatimonadetes bacterium 21-71-4]|nr:MAG: hypothetical protein B7Z72_12960 [Gemmatimonadetes bacterium 21-71-4]
MPDKGRVLNGLSAFWFARTDCPNHVLSTDIDDAGLNLAAAVRDDQKGLKRWLVTTVVGGATFVGVQVHEYIHLVGKGFLPSSGLFGAAFYTMTGFHGFHVTCGVLSMIWVTIRAFRGKYAGGKYQGIETIGLYWHFVDLVWIILFTIVYLI